MSFLERHSRTLQRLLVFFVIFVILVVLLTLVAALLGLGISFFELPLVVVLALVGTWIVLRRSQSSQPKP